MSSGRLVIIGAGAAGLAAAKAAREAGCADILVIERLPYPGGILAQCVHNGFGLRIPGFDLTGQGYAAWLCEQLAGLAISVLLDTAVIDLKSDGFLTLVGPNGVELRQADAVILASGCRERPLGTQTVAGTRPAGVFAAGSAQKMVNLGGWSIGQRIVILGSGDVGMIMARQFVQQGKEVLAVIEKGQKCGGLAHNQRDCLEALSIPLILQSTVTELLGSGRLQAVRVVDLTSAEEYSINCDTLVTSIGLIPEIELLRTAGAAIEAGSALLDDTMASRNLPWLFVAGNARKVHSFVDTVMDDGAAAGTAAAADPCP